jgi:pyridoxal/pyridoxine/pyridoxamine kinase
MRPKTLLTNRRKIKKMTPEVLLDAVKKFESELKMTYYREILSGYIGTMLKMGKL